MSFKSTTPSGRLDITRLVRLLGRIRLSHPLVNERELVDRLVGEIVSHGCSVEREIVIRGVGRVDLLVDGSIVVECKRGKPRAAAVEAQVKRYASSPHVRAVILVSERTLGSRPELESHGKPIHYVTLSTSWGVA